MHRHGILVLTTFVVGLCMLAGGCAHSMRVEPPFARHERTVKESDVASLPKNLPLPPKSKWAQDERNPSSDFVKPNLTLCKAEKPVASKGYELAPLPPVITRTTLTEPKRVPSFEDGPARRPKQIPSASAVPLPIEKLAQATSPNPEVVPLPKGEPVSDLMKAFKALKSAASSGKDTNAKDMKKPAPTRNGDSNATISSSNSGGKTSISLHADDLDVRKALEMISRQANMNILVSPGVTGTLTVDIRDQTVDQALRAIAQLCGLLIRYERSYVYFTTPEELRLIEQDNMPVRVYRLNYVNSSDVETMVKPLLSEEGVFTASPDSEVGLKSDASRAGDKAKEVKAGGNSLAGGDIVIVQDYENVLKTIDRVIAEIDVKPVQVLIEAVIVEVKLDKGMELGVNFALLDGAQRAMGVAGSGAAINAAAGFIPASVLAAGDTGLIKGTPTTGLAQADPGMKFGFVDKSTTGFIKALETMGETKILATPRLLVLNKQRAEIHLGKKLGYATSTQTQTSTVEKVEFEDVGTQLRLRPFISSDGMIRMEVRPERSTGHIDADGIPQVDATQVTTNVMVPDGSTLVIGGLIESDVVQTWSGIPLLSRLPWVGYLFRETDDDVKKRELVVILTPRIWRPGCPEQLNYVGRPNTLGLDARVAQKLCEENRDGPSLYELTQPMMPCPPGGPPLMEFLPAEAQ